MAGNSGDTTGLGTDSSLTPSYATTQPKPATTTQTPSASSDGYSSAAANPSYSSQDWTPYNPTPTNSALPPGATTQTATNTQTSSIPGASGGGSIPLSGSSGGPTSVTQDQQARSIYADLQAAGHDVSWQGSQLMVDGRPYAVTGSSMPNVPSGNAAAASAGQNGGVDVSGMNPQLVALFQKYGVTPTGQGTGNSDIAYWNAKLSAPGADQAYYLNRLESDFAGGGPDTGAGGGGGSMDLSGIIPSYAQVSSIGDPSALHPNIDFSGNPGTPGVYTPGAITFDDIPNFTPDQLTAAQRSGGAASSLDSLMQNITDNPTSMDQHTVDTMKAQSKDALAEQGQLNDQYTQGQAGALGIGDSPWLASERAAARRSTGQAIASQNANIDVQAGQTRQAQKIASAQAGQGYQQLRSQQVMNGVNAGLQRAQLTGDRMALRESVAQAAAKSGQDQYSLIANWLEQRTGQKISAAALKQQGQMFSENLMMQLAGMNVGAQEFGAQFGLQAAGLENQMSYQANALGQNDTNNITPTPGG